MGYHGCEKPVTEKVLAGGDHLKQSNNSYDWLGPGIYFWVDSPERAYAWAKERKLKNPSVIGAFIYPGLCLNLTDYGINEELLESHHVLKMMNLTYDRPLPKNSIKNSGVFLKRELDCAVIQMLHDMRQAKNEEPYDSVYGVFEEGSSLFEGSGFKQKTHVQIAIRNTECIQGYFRVAENRYK